MTAESTCVYIYMCVSVTPPTLQTYNGGETRRDKNKNKNKIKNKKRESPGKKKVKFHAGAAAPLCREVCPSFFSSSSFLSSVCQQNAKHWTDAFIKASGSHFELCRFVKSTVPKKKTICKDKSISVSTRCGLKKNRGKRGRHWSTRLPRHMKATHTKHTHTQKKNAKATRRVTHDHSPIMNEIAAEVVDEHLFFFVCVFACLSSWCIPSICIHIYIYMRLLQSFPSHGTIKTTETK